MSGLARLGEEVGGVEFWDYVSRDYVKFGGV
jgi:hypothetical protein